MIQDLSGSWCIKGTGESTLVMDSPVPLMHHDPDRSWISDPDPDRSLRPPGNVSVTNLFLLIKLNKCTISNLKYP